MSECMIVKRGGSGTKIDGTTEATVIVDSDVKKGDLVYGGLPTISLTNPDKIPTGYGNGYFYLDFTIENDYAMFIGDTTNSAVVYKKKGDIWTVVYDKDILVKYLEIETNIISMTVSHDGKLLAVGLGSLSPENVYIFKINEDDSLTFITKFLSSITHQNIMRFAPDNNYLFIGYANSSNPTQVYKIIDGTIFSLLTTTALSAVTYINGISFSRDNQYVVMGQSDTKPKLFKREGDNWTAITLSAISNNQRDACISPDGQYIAFAMVSSGSAYNNVAIIKTNNGAPTLLTYLSTGGTSDHTALTVSWSKDSSQLLVGTQSGFKVYQRVNDTFGALSYTPYMNGYAKFSNEDIPTIWGSNNSKNLHIFAKKGEDYADLDPLTPYATGGVRASAFSPDSKTLVFSTASPSEVRVIDLAGERPVQVDNAIDVMPTGVPYDIAFSPDGKLLAMAHFTTPYISIYWVNEDKTLRKLSNPGVLPTGNGNGVCFNHDGTYMAVGHQGSPYVTVYQILSGEFGYTFSKIANPSTLASGGGQKPRYSPDGKHLALPASGSTEVLVYEQDGITLTSIIVNGLPQFEGLSCCFVDNDILVVGTTQSGTSSYPTVLTYELKMTAAGKRWIPKTGNIVNNQFILKTMTHMGKTKWGCIVNMEASSIVYDKSSRSLYVRDVENSIEKQTVTTLSGTTNGVQTIELSPDGNYLLIGMSGSKKYLGLYKREFSKTRYAPFETGIVQKDAPKGTPVKIQLLP